MFQIIFHFGMIVRCLRMLLISLRSCFFCQIKLLFSVIIGVGRIFCAFVFCWFYMESFDIIFFMNDAFLHLFQSLLQRFAISWIILQIKSVFLEHDRMILCKYFCFRCVFQLMRQFLMIGQLILEVTEKNIIIRYTRIQLFFFLMHSIYLFRDLSANSFQFYDLFANALILWYDLTNTLKFGSFIFNMGFWYLTFFAYLTIFLCSCFDLALLLLKNRKLSLYLLKLFFKLLYACL